MHQRPRALLMRRCSQYDALMHYSVGSPVVVQNNTAVEQIIVGDFTRATIIQVEGLSVAFFDRDQDNVVRNLLTAKVPARVAFSDIRKDAFNVFTAGTT